MSQLLRIGTRDSKLALWQATHVQDLLKARDIQSELVLIKSEGDLNLTTPLYELGVQGIFTKTLDIALLENRIDLAVHSYKDVPTKPAEGIVMMAVLSRTNPFDVLVTKGEMPSDKNIFKIATSSIRRKAQWLHRYPGSTIENLRGNVQTRLQKLKDSDWDGAIFAAAGLERLGLTEKQTGPQVQLDWMLPAPAQGALAIAARTNDHITQSACAFLEDQSVRLCTEAERTFLRELQGGCSTPISAYVTHEGGLLNLKGNICSVDGTKSVDVELELHAPDAIALGKKAAELIIEKGGNDLLTT